MSARDVGGTTNRDSLSACYPDGAAMLVEVNATAMTELLLVRLITKIREVIASLLVRNEVQQTQELVVNASRGRHAYRQKRHSATVARGFRPNLTRERRGSLFQTDPQERTKPNEASSDDAPSTHAYIHTQTQTYTDTDTKTDAHPERRSMIEEGGSRKKSSREVKGDRCQKEEVTLDHHWMS